MTAGEGGAVGGGEQVEELVVLVRGETEVLGAAGDDGRVEGGHGGGRVPAAGAVGERA